MPPKIAEILRLLHDAGWYVAATRGSHRQLRHPERPGRVTVAGKPGDDVAPGTLKSILKQAGLRKVREPVRYAIVIEKAGQNYSAYAPDVPGCIATGASVAETEVAIREAVAFHLEGLREDSIPLPEPSSRVSYVDVAA